MADTLARPKELIAYPLRDDALAGWDERISGRWSYADLVRDPAWFRGWISFDSLCWDSRSSKLYCGLNALDSDILYSFDPVTSRFQCLNSRRWTDKYDVKIHRTLLQNPRDHCLYFATSLLHDVDQQQEAMGGKLVRYDPASDRFEVLAVPVPHLYVQSIAADWDRNIVYGFTYPAEAVFRTELSSGASRVLAYTGNSTMMSQPHNSIVDHGGWLWGTYAETRAWEERSGREPIRLFKYHPDRDRFVWFDHGLARRESGEQLLDDPTGVPTLEIVQGEIRQKDDFGFCDSMVYDGSRFIYAGTVAGVLCRIDTETGKVEKLANVISSGRFPALAIKDGILYGAGGLRGHTQLVRWKIGSDRIECFSDLSDLRTHEQPERVHEIAVDEGHRIYLAEDDNHHRSSYLWAARLD